MVSTSDLSTVNAKIQRILVVSPAPQRRRHLCIVLGRQGRVRLFRFDARSTVTVCVSLQLGGLFFVLVEMGNPRTVFFRIEHG